MKTFIIILLSCVSVAAAEIRAVWVNPVSASSEETIKAEVTNKVNQLVALKANTYLANLTEAHWHSITNGTSYDDIAEIIRIARAQNIDTYLWYAPWYVKSSSPALIAHPEWQTVRNTGVTNAASFCLLRPEVREQELAVLTNAALRWSGLTGVHLEEPGYASIFYCFCTYCTNYFMTNQGVDITLEDTTATNAKRTTYTAAGTNFVQQLRSNLLTINSALKLSSNTQSYNSDTSARIGNNWMSWSTNGWIDWFSPQLYRTNPATGSDNFSNNVVSVKSTLASVVMVPGIGIGWSSPLITNSAETVVEEIGIARGLGVVGFSLFRNEFIDANMVSAVAGTYIPQNPPKKSRPGGRIRGFGQ